MNKVYKVIYSKVKQCYVVVSEIAKSHGRHTKSSVAKSSAALTAGVLIALGSFSFEGMPVAQADGILTDDGSVRNNDFVGANDYYWYYDEKEKDETKKWKTYQYKATDAFNNRSRHDLPNYKGAGAKLPGAITAGLSAQAGQQTVTIGDRNAGKSKGSVFIGEHSGYDDGGDNLAKGASNNYVTSVGFQSDATGWGSIAIGSNAIAENSKMNSDTVKEEGNYNTTGTVRDDTYSIEANPTIDGASVALGYNAHSKDGNIAIGANSDATSTDGGDSYLSVGSETLKRRITNVAQGTGDSDVVTLGQMNEAIKKTDASNKANINASNIGNNLTVDPVYQTDEKGAIIKGSDDQPLIDEEKTTAKRNEDQATNKNAWGAAIGTGSIADPTKSEKNDPAKNGSQQLVTGGTVYNALQQQADNLKVNAGWGINVTDEKDPTNTGKVTKNVISLKHNLGTGYNDDEAKGMIIGGLVEDRDPAKQYGAADANSVIVGAGKALASGKSSVVVGGLDNVASGATSVVIGGDNNNAAGNQSAVFGGRDNTAGGIASTAGGGIMNVANGQQAVALGGAYNYALGVSSTAIGGMGGNGMYDYSTSVNGNYSVSLAGGSTGTDALNGLAAGNQSVVTTANGTAVGYQATTNKEGTIAFGHDAGDVSGYAVTWKQRIDGKTNADHTTNDYTQVPDSVTPTTYKDAYYNRLVKVADGQDDHDVVVMEQLTKATSDLTKDLSVNAGWGINVNDVTTKNDGGMETTTKNVISLNRNLGTNYGNPWKGEGKVTFEASGENSLILGGAASILFNNEGDNVKAGAYGKDSVLVGGFNNLIDTVANDVTQTGEDAVIVGGDTNTVTGLGSVIVGGSQNKVSGGHSIVIGGASNETDGGGAGVFGGQLNKAAGEYSSVLGGVHNEADGDWSSAIGGTTNTASGLYATTLGGKNNDAKGKESVVVGGGQNVAIGEDSTVNGGAENTSYGMSSYAAGGMKNMAFGNASVALGGINSNVNAKVSTGIAGGSTEEKAFTALAAGHQSVVTNSGVEWRKVTQEDVDAINQKLPSWSGFIYTEAEDPYTTYVLDKVSTAVGYQSTADAPGVIAFGHDKGDVASVAKKWKQKATMEVGDDYSAKFYDANHNEISDEDYYKLVNADGTWNDYTQDPIGTENTTYQSAYYNRLVKAADGIDAHDAVVMEQLKPYTKSDASNIGANLKTYTVGDDGETITETDATADQKKTNKDNWGKALGAEPFTTGTSAAATNASTSDQLVTGKTLYNYDAPVAETGKTLNYVSANNTTGQNLSALDAQVKANADKGLKFAANSGAEYTAKLGSTVKIQGTAKKENHEYTADNLTTEIDKDGNITILMDKDMSVEKLAVNGKDGKEGAPSTPGSIGISGQDGQSSVGIDGKDGISIKGRDGKDGVTMKAVDGENGTEGHIGLTGPAGTNGIKGANGQPGTSIDITVKNGYDGTDGKDGVKGEKGVDGTSLTRIVYKDGAGEHQVATMEDGMKYAGDDAQTDTTKVIAKKLNNTLDIIGGADSKNLTEGNIGVNSTDKGQLKVQLAKDLTGITSISNQRTEGGKTTGAKITLGTDGSVNVNGGKIINVGSGIEKDATDNITEASKTNAANIGDVQTIAESTATSLTGKGLKFAANSGAEYTAKLGSTVNIQGTAKKEGHEYTADNLTTEIDEKGNITILMDKNVSAEQIAVNGKDGENGKPGTAGSIGINGQDGKSGIGIDGKDGISIKGEDGHIGLNGSDGITVRGLDGENGAPGKDGVTITGPKGEAGKDGIDGKVGISGKDGKDAVSISGKDGVGHIGLTGPAGTNGKDGASIDITVKNGSDDAAKGINGTNGVDGKDGITRIVYTDKNGEHQVATMEDGLKFKGDDGTEIAKKLNNTMEIIGGADSTKLTDKNIGVNSDGDKLKVQLSKDLTGMNSTTYTTTTGEGESATTSTTVVNGNGLTITDGPSITNKGIDGGNKVITNVGSGIEKNKNGKYTVTKQNQGNAANIGDVQNMVNDAKTELTDGANGLNNKANIDASNIGANLKNADGSVASAEDQKANAEKWGSAIGTGEIKADDGRMVTGKTVYDEVRPTKDGSYVKKDKTTGENLSALDSKIGSMDKDGNYIKKDDSISNNLSALDTHVKANENAIKKNSESIQNITNNVKNLSDNAVQYDKDSNKTTVTLAGKGGTTITNVKDGALSDSSTDAVNGKQLYNEQKAREAADEAITENVTNNTNEITKIKNGEGFTNTGKTIIKNLSKDAVQVKAGDRIKVDEATDEKTGNKTYTISANNNGTVAKGDGNLISGDTLYKEVHVDKDGSYIKAARTVGQNLSALDSGLKTTSDLIHTNDKGDTIQIGADSKATKVDISGKDAKGNKTGRVITGVVSDASDPNSAANVGYVNGITAASNEQIYRDMNMQYNHVENDISRAAAGSNALAALHPMQEFDPDDKAQFALGYGHYRNSNAGAVGAFYQPDENSLFSFGVSFGNGDAGLNAGVTFKFGPGGSDHHALTKTQMAKVIDAQSKEIDELKKDNADKDKRIDALEQKMTEILARLDKSQA